MEGHIVNNESVRVQITRGDLINVLLALDAAHEIEPQAKKWVRLHDELRAILDKHDAAAAEKGWRG